jgi:hypothetical protein
MIMQPTTLVQFFKQIMQYRDTYGTKEFISLIHEEMKEVL